MAKKSGKSNAFPVEEAINAAAHFDVSGVRSGIVELLSGHEAQAEFYSKRADGAYYKPHQIYYAIYRPKDEYRVPIAPRHYQEGSDRPTVQDCEDYYNPVEPFIEGFPADTQYPLPKGTPFFIKFLKDGTDGERFGILGTHDVDPYDRRKIQQAFNTYIATRIIPKGGRSILRDTVSRMGVKSTPVRDENGVLHNVVITCAEVRPDGTMCGGVYKRDGRGDYVCQNCGIIYEREDKFVAEDIGEDYDYESEDDVLEEATTQKDLEVGGILPPAMSAIESRLARNIMKFRTSTSKAPKDELEAKDKLHADVERTARAKKAFAKLNGHQVYENKWTIKQQSYRTFKAIAHIKAGNATTSTLSKFLNIGTKQLYNIINSLEAAGRIELSKVKGAHCTSLRIVGYGLLSLENPGEVVIRTRAKVQVMPVLPQVRYGGIQRTTINYRNSSIAMKVGIPFDGEHPTSLYTRKE